MKFLDKMNEPHQDYQLLEACQNYYEELKDTENEFFSKTITYHDITHDDMKNGDGLRVVLWVAGCEHHCAQCHNPITWDPNGGRELTPWEEAEFWEWLKKPWTQGATFSGGDPLHPANRDKIGEMCRQIKKEYPKKDIWVYTGYVLKKDETGFCFANAQGYTFTLPWLESIDILVDGRFEAETRQKDLEEKKVVHWRGSSNQRIIDIQNTIVAGEVICRKEKK